MQFPEGSLDEQEGSEGERSGEQDGSTENNTDIEREEKNFITQ